MCVFLCSVPRNRRGKEVKCFWWQEQNYSTTLCKCFMVKIQFCYSLGNVTRGMVLLLFWAACSCKKKIKKSNPSGTWSLVFFILSQSVTVRRMLWVEKHAHKHSSYSLPISVYLTVWAYTSYEDYAGAHWCLNCKYFFKQIKYSFSVNISQNISFRFCKSMNIKKKPLKIYNQM